MLWKLVLFCGVTAAAVQADTVYATRTIRPTEILTGDDIGVSGKDTPGAFSDPLNVIGQEARVALYAGRPIRSGDLRPPAVVVRNALVDLVYMQSGLEIVTEGRALGRAAVGETVFVMNTSSRGRVSGRVLADGRVVVE